MTPRRARWDALWQRLGAVPSEEAFAELERQYSAPGRHYHTLAHLDAVLVTFDELRHLAPNPDIAELALWLHDVIWEPMRDDCEQRSVEWAMNHLPALPALPALKRRPHQPTRPDRHGDAVRERQRGPVVHEVVRRQ